MRRISIEREFALWRGNRPLPRRETERFKSLMEKRTGSLGISTVEREVAPNSLEVTFSLINRREWRERLLTMRQGVERLAREEGMDVVWTNQPIHIPESHTEFFTTMAFPATVNTFCHAISLHVHFETGPSQVVDAYNAMNTIAPELMMGSSRHGGGRSRLAMVAEFTEVFGELSLPQHILSVQDYADYLVSMSSYQEERMAREGTLQRVMTNFPKMFNSEGRLVLTPDKVFHPARIRPDMELENGNISLEFRAIDGIADATVEADMVQAAIDVYDSAPRIRPGIRDARRFLKSLGNATEPALEGPITREAHANA